MLGPKLFCGNTYSKNTQHSLRQFFCRQEHSGCANVHLAFGFMVPARQVKQTIYGIYNKLDDGANVSGHT